MKLTNKNYYQTKILSVSSVKLFAQNPARALADFTGQFPWSDDLIITPLKSAFHDMLTRAVEYTCNKKIIANASKNLTDDSWIQKTLDLAEKRASKSVITEMLKADKYLHLRSTNGNLISIAEKIPIWFHILWNSDVMKNVGIQAMMSTQTEDVDIVIEKPFVGIYKLDNQNIKYKGKPNLFIVNHKQKSLDVFNYKISLPFDPSGYDWGNDITGKRQYMPIEWTAEKLFPWQAGVYRQLLWDNGYKDYQIRYRFLVITKEKTPRLNVFTISKESMDEGYSQFKYYLILAHGYVSGELKDPPLIQDGSKFANMQSYKHPLSFVSQPFYNKKSN